MPGANNIEVGIGLKDRLTNDLKRVTSNLSTFRSKAVGAFQTIGRTIFNVRTAIVGLAGALAIRSFVRIIKSTTDLNDQFQKLSIRLGISTELLSGLRFAGEQSGIEFTQLTDALEQATRRLEEFRQRGSGPAGDALALLGGNLRETALDGVTLETLLPEISDGMKNLATDAQRAFVSYSLFGRSGIKVGNQLLSQGSKYIQDFLNQAKKFGIIIGRDAADASAEFNDSLNRLSKSLEGLRQKVVEPLLGPLTGFVDLLTDLAVDNRTVIIDFFKNVGYAIKDIAISSMVLYQSWLSIKLIIAQMERLTVMTSAKEFPFHKFQGPNAKENADKYIKSIRNQIEAVRRLQEQLKLGPKIEYSKEQPISKRGRDALEELRWHVATLPLDATKLGLTQTIGAPPTREQLFEREQSAVEGFRQALRQLHQEGTALATMRQGVLGLADSFSFNLSTGIANAASNFKNAGQAFAEMAKSIAADIAMLIPRLLIMRAISVGLSGLGIGAPAGRYVPGSTAPFYYGPSAQTGGIFSGPASGYPVLLHGREKVTVEPLGSRRGGEGEVVLNYNPTINIQAIDAQSFNQRSSGWAVTHGEELAGIIANQLKRKPRLMRAGSR